MIDSLASFYVWLSPKEVSDKHWYLSPEQHALEILMLTSVNLVMLFCMYRIRRGRGRGDKGIKEEKKGIKDMLEERNVRI